MDLSNSSGNGLPASSPVVGTHSPSIIFKSSLSSQYAGTVRHRMRIGERNATRFTPFSRMSGLLDEVHRLELLAEHHLTVHLEPVLQQSRVHAAEVGVVPEVAVGEVVQARMTADRAGLDARPDHEQARPAAVVRSF